MVPEAGLSPSLSIHAWPSPGLVLGPGSLCSRRGKRDSGIAREHGLRAPGGVSARQTVAVAQGHPLADDTAAPQASESPTTGRARVVLGTSLLHT